MQQIVEAGGDGTVRIGLVPSVSSPCFPAAANAGPGVSAPEGGVSRSTNDALFCELRSGKIDFAVGAIDSSLPPELQVYPLRDDPFVAVLHCDDPLAGQPHLPWKLLAGRDIAVFSKGNIQRLVGAWRRAIASR